MESQPDNYTTLDRIYDALNRHDAAAVAALASDAITVDAIPLRTVATGRKAVEENYRDYFHAFPDVRYRSVNRIEQGDSIVDEWVMSGTLKGELQMGKLVVQPTNQHFELRGVNVFRFSGGLVRELRVYYDALSFARQLGLTALLQARAVGD